MSQKLGFGFMRLPLLDQEDQTSIDFSAVGENGRPVFRERIYLL